jgi:hypothetical protein
VQKDEQAPNMILSLSFLFCREKEHLGIRERLGDAECVRIPYTEYAVAYTSAVV